MRSMTLSPLDWLALAWFLVMWIAYDRFAELRARSHPSMLHRVNLARRDWMYQLTFRENRIADVALMANLSSSPTFFASTTMIVIGGLFAMLGTTSKVVHVVQEIPFAVDVPEEVWNVKIIVMVCIFVFTFFRFTWALRQFNFCSIMIGSAPNMQDFLKLPESARIDFANRTGKLVALAGESFNDGLRGYYFAIAALTWFVQPLAYMLATSVVVLILYFREFHSSALRAMTDGA
ncbi:DUF599 domain-containing protein [Noviherbaspirillum pedocola]|uniref:DUF599 domain-containing protein n=1 Tax=Noviherbaspirillum pedocola TaxID=2801341 RepID=A0A934SZF7_9BURK|nr:DUF599 domain-containing protein [Noviherbaspirillum pedocola]MBK4738547.1 DUF599 domain-containing protein [Noviherbaspirillum pedocola]